MDTVIEHQIPKLSLRGSQMDINDDLNHTNVIETVSLGAPEEGFRAAIRKSMAENMLGKTVEKAVIDSNGIEICAKGTPLTEDAIDRILNSDVDEVKVRKLPFELALLRTIQATPIRLLQPLKYYSEWRKKIMSNIILRI